MNRRGRPQGEFRPGPSTPDSDGFVSGTDLERRADVDAIERLHNERRKLYAQNGKLIALYGPFGIFDDRRKQILEAIKTRIRMEARQKGEKLTNDETGERAHADTQYAAYLDMALDEKIEYLRVWNRISEINELIQNRAIALSAYKAELRLAPALD